MNEKKKLVKRFQKKMSLLMKHSMKKHGDKKVTDLSRRTGIEYYTAIDIVNGCHGKMSALVRAADYVETLGGSIEEPRVFYDTKRTKEIIIVDDED